ncbi:hypothetical protein RRG08_001651 [Elysia crispata]|uniref:Uncharacterized protein n=1 Tax=Elysia crispata TaxID=231223 RepID=A0AAE1ALB6_9GAST|nr:hypothetical protein RRG08_001651 [Elysia crispata]
MHVQHSALQLVVGGVGGGRLPNKHNILASGTFIDSMVAHRYIVWDGHGGEPVLSLACRQKHPTWDSLEMNDAHWTRVPGFGNKMWRQDNESRVHG